MTLMWHESQKPHFIAISCCVKEVFARSVFARLIRSAVISSLRDRPVAARKCVSSVRRETCRCDTRSETLNFRPKFASISIRHWLTSSFLTVLRLVERREKWAERQSPESFALREDVLSTPNLVAVFTGHIHRGLVASERGKPLFSVPCSNKGFFWDVRIAG